MYLGPIVQVDTDDIDRTNMGGYFQEEYIKLKWRHVQGYEASLLLGDP